MLKVKIPEQQTAAQLGLIHKITFKVGIGAPTSIRRSAATGNRALITAYADPFATAITGVVIVLDYFQRLASVTARHPHPDGHFENISLLVYGISGCADSRSSRCVVIIVNAIVFIAGAD